MVNKKFDPDQIINAVAHMSAGLVNLHNQNRSTERMRFRDFYDKEKSPHPSISENGFIILRAENSNKIRTLRNQLIEKSILFTDFTDVMIKGNHIIQQDEFDTKIEEELEYLGVCCFMDIEESRKLTKKFSIHQMKL